MKTYTLRSQRAAAASLCLLLGAAPLTFAQTGTAVNLQIKADQITAKMPPTFHGLMTEEINYAFEGGLYPELIRNRNFKEFVPARQNRQNPQASTPGKEPKDLVHWSLMEEHGGTGTMMLDTSTPLNSAVPASLKLTVSQASGKGEVGVANDGFWGIPVTPDTTYKVMFYAKSAPGYTGGMTASIVSNDGATNRSCRPGPQADRRLAEIRAHPQDQPHRKGFRREQIRALCQQARHRLDRFRLALPANLQRSSQRIPQGHHGAARRPQARVPPLPRRQLPRRQHLRHPLQLEDHRSARLKSGPAISTTHGDTGPPTAWACLNISTGAKTSAWSPVLAVFDGYALRGERAKPGPELDPFIQEALEEIEYVSGDTSTTWGARRAKDGHPAPFKLRYVEIGNEDFFDREKGSYDIRFTAFHDAIKAKYPNLLLIDSGGTSAALLTTRTPDVNDDHYYRGSDEMAFNANNYDSRVRVNRGGGPNAPPVPKVFVGEWATRVGSPTPNMEAALGDAANMGRARTQTRTS